MGIKGLFPLIKEEAPDSFKEGEIKNHFGRKVAIVSRIDVCNSDQRLTIPGCVRCLFYQDGRAELTFVGQ